MLLHLWPKEKSFRRAWRSPGQQKIRITFHRYTKNLTLNKEEIRAWKSLLSCNWSVWNCCSLSLIQENFTIPIFKFPPRTLASMGKCELQAWLWATPHLILNTGLRNFTSHFKCGSKQLCVSVLMRSCELRVLITMWPWEDCECRIYTIARGPHPARDRCFYCNWPHYWVN